jgi:hypothetical protein
LAPLFTPPKTLASGTSTQSLTGRVVKATLVLHGTSGQPDYRKKGARVYDDNFNKLAKSVGIL